MSLPQSTRRCTHMFMHKYIHTHICIHTSNELTVTRVTFCTQMHTYIHTRTHICIHTSTKLTVTRVTVYTQTHIHIYTYIYLNTYIHVIHALPPTSWPWLGSRSTHRHTYIYISKYVYIRHTRITSNELTVTWVTVYTQTHIHIYTYLYRKPLYTHYLQRVGHTGWRRLIGSPMLQIIFHKRATKYRSLLRKMTCKEKGSYESSPPCNSGHSLCARPTRIYIHM